MKKYFTLSLSALSFLLIFGCSSDNETEETTPDKPTAEFTFTGNNNPAPAAIVFENKSTNATNYLWDFGDNGSSLEKNPSHTYTAAGTYTIKLTTTGIGGTVSTTKTITVTSPPIPTGVKITKVTITEMPFTDDEGNNWDSSDGPDVQFFIVDEKTYKDQISSEIYKDILKTQLPLSWTLTTPKLITNFSEEYVFSIVDIDGISGYSIGGDVYAKMTDYTTGPNAYPKTITLQYNADSPSRRVTFVIDLTWL